MKAPGKCRMSLHLAGNFTYCNATRTLAVIATCEPLSIEVRKLVGWCWLLRVGLTA